MLLYSSYPYENLDGEISVYPLPYYTSAMQSQTQIKEHKWKEEEKTTNSSLPHPALQRQLSCASSLSLKAKLNGSQSIFFFLQYMYERCLHTSFREGSKNGKLFDQYLF